MIKRKEEAKIVGGKESHFFLFFGAQAWSWKQQYGNTTMVLLWIWKEPVTLPPLTHTG